MAKILGKDVHGNALDDAGNPIVAPAAVETPAPETPVAVNPEPAAPVVAEVEDEDAKFLARYNKIHGTEHQSIKDITTSKRNPTKEEIEEAEKQERLEAFDWALQNKVFDKDTYDKAVVEKAKNPRDIAFALFTEEYNAEFPNSKPEDVEESFKDFYGEYSDADSARYKLGQKRIKETASNYLKQFENIDKHVDSYKEYKTGAEKVKSFKNTLRAVSETIPSELSFEVPVEKDGKTENVTYSFPVTDDMKKDIFSEYSKNNWAFDAFNAGSREVKEKDLLSAMQNTIFAKHAIKMVQHVAGEHGKKMRQELLAELAAVPARTTPKPNVLNAPAAPTPVVVRSENTRQRLGM